MPLESQDNGGTEFDPRRASLLATVEGYLAAAEAPEEWEPVEGRHPVVTVHVGECASESEGALPRYHVLAVRRTAGKEALVAMHEHNYYAKLHDGRMLRTIDRAVLLAEWESLLRNAQNYNGTRERLQNFLHEADCFRALLERLLGDDILPLRRFPVPASVERNSSSSEAESHWVLQVLQAIWQVLVRILQVLCT